MVSVINEKGELNEKCGVFSVSIGILSVASSQCICQHVTQALHDSYNLL